MRTTNLLGEEIWICDRDEANRLAREYPNDRWRLWLEAEVDRWLLATPKQIAEVIEKKRTRPGPYLT